MRDFFLVNTKNSKIILFRIIITINVGKEVL